MAQIWQAGGARLIPMYLLLLSLAALIYWYADDSMRVVTALIAFCPCVFVLTGAAVDTSARSSLARRGMLVRSDSALEALGQTETIVFDVDALSHTDSLCADLPHIATSLRHMGLHPALQTGFDADTTSRVSALRECAKHLTKNTPYSSAPPPPHCMRNIRASCAST